MQIEPQAPAFAKRYARGEAQVVWTTLVSDLETPVSAFLKIATARPPCFLLEVELDRLLSERQTARKPLPKAKKADLVAALLELRICQTEQCSARRYATCQSFGSTE